MYSVIWTISANDGSLKANGSSDEDTPSTEHMLFLLKLKTNKLSITAFPLHKHNQSMQEGRELKYQTQQDSQEQEAHTCFCRAGLKQLVMSSFGWSQTMNLQRSPAGLFILPWFSTAKEFPPSLHL